MKVLLVEDEIDVGKVILSYLKQWEMEAIHAESSQDALKVLDDGAVDLLITDLVMPEMDGFDLVKAIRREKRHRKMPVLMISGQAEKEHILKASRIGIKGFVAKPFTSDQLKQAISSKVKQLTEDMRQTVQ